MCRPLSASALRFNGDPMKNLFTALSLLLLSFAVCAGDTYQEDIDYFPVIPEQAGAEGQRVEVAEFFWFGCGHCFTFEPHLHGWIKDKPEYVDVVLIPAMFERPEVEMHAKTFYALKLLGVEEPLHGKIFEAMHAQKRNLNTQEAMETFLGENGVNVEEYRKAMKSFAVETQAKRAALLAERYDIRGVPSIVVDGKYRISGLESQKMLGVLNHLIEQVRTRKGAAAPK
jgi:protein dithiol oxidoreductase (disulfide-forming)